MSVCSIATRVYRPRNPKTTRLHQIVSENWQEFLEVYPERFEEKYGYLRTEVEETLEKYLKCGILSYGFARIKCEECGHEYLLAYSCKGRYFCPSCHKRRVEEFGLFLIEHILENVAHRQIVFSLPKILRKHFMHNRKLLPKLSHCGWETVVEVFQSTLRRYDVTPGMVTGIQTYGQLGNWNPHLHCLCSDGCFDSEGIFYPLPNISVQTLEKVFAARVFTMLINEKLISPEMVQKMLSWRHSGFSAHAKRKLEAEDKDGLESLAQYIVRSPISEEKIILSADGSNVIYRARFNPALGRNFQSFNVLEFLAVLTSHIPAKGKKMTIYYGWYSQPARGKRKRDGKLTVGTPLFCSQTDDDNRTLRYRWSQLIKRIYADPLICPACGGHMRIIAFIQEPEVIERILKHCGQLSSEFFKHEHGPPEEEPIEDSLSYEPFFDDFPQ